MLAHLVLVDSAIDRKVQREFVVVHEEFQMPVTRFCLEGRGIRRLRC